MDWLKELSNNHLDDMCFVPGEAIEDSKPATPTPPPPRNSAEPSHNNNNVDRRIKSKSLNQHPRPRHNNISQTTTSVGSKSGSKMMMINPRSSNLNHKKHIDQDKLTLGDRVQPRMRTHLIGNTKAIQAIEKWMQSCLDGTAKKRVLMVYGPSGCGKSAAIRVLAEHYNFIARYVDTSELDSVENVKQSLGGRIVHTSDSMDHLQLQKESSSMVIVDGLESLPNAEGLADLFKPFRSYALGSAQASRVATARKKSIDNYQLFDNIETPVVSDAAAATAADASSFSVGGGVGGIGRLILVKNKKKTKTKDGSSDPAPSTRMPSALICISNTKPKSFGSAQKYYHLYSQAVYFNPLKRKDLNDIFIRTMSHVGTPRRFSITQQRNFDLFVDRCGGDARYMLNHLEVSGLLVTGAPDDRILSKVPARVGDCDLFQILKDAFYPVKNIEGLSIKRQREVVKEYPKDDVAELDRLFFRNPQSLLPYVFENHIPMAVNSSTSGHRNIDHIAEISCMLSDADLFSNSVTQCQNFGMMPFVSRFGFVRPVQMLRSYRPTPETFTNQFQHPPSVMYDVTPKRFKPMPDMSVDEVLNRRRKRVVIPKKTTSTPKKQNSRNPSSKSRSTSSSSSNKNTMKKTNNTNKKIMEQDQNAKKKNLTKKDFFSIKP